MANRRLIRTGAGSLAKPNKIVMPPDGKPGPEILLALNSFMENITRKINGFISFGDGSQSSHSGNIFGQYVEFVTSSTINTEIAIDHGLSKPIIARLIVRQDKAAHLYDSNLGGWGQSRVYFKCDVADVLFKVLLLADQSIT